MPNSEGARSAFDPTPNVKDAFDRLTKRQDDLRAADERFMLAEIAHLKETAELRAQHQRELDAAEANRLNAIRQVDREEVIKTAAAAQTAIQTLAQTTSTTAETLRAQVAGTATTIATQLSTISGEINKRLSALELASSERQGKQTVADPAMALLAQRVETLLESRSLASGERRGVNWVVVAVVGAVGFIATLLGIAGTLWAVLAK